MKSFLLITLPVLLLEGIALHEIDLTTLISQLLLLLVALSLKRARIFISSVTMVLPLVLGCSMAEIGISLEVSLAILSLNFP
ncbi:hypothetical protein GWK48_09995 [Metallosphaera tengchongensis]|uniref:Uncharacterized protein n=1 Tax=Metallosphaera tengchongensis TaxID=1532350 RepID=A0A6N0NXS5_9CREN|nr:hypothetical protein [Metallosphaera tengchongensis]QKR00673.1 hypothetical protein GWK48_09995 [Metallosphaera tengchongensis]